MLHHPGPSKNTDALLPMLRRKKEEEEEVEVEKTPAQMPNPKLKPGYNVLKSNTNPLCF